MKLLFDQNLPPRLVGALEDLFPNSAHVFPLGLGTGDDQTIWNVARDDDFTIVSKDRDFASMSLLLGAPPKVIWIALGNCSSAQVEQLLRGAAPSIEAFGAEDSETYMVLT